MHKITKAPIQPLNIVQQRSWIRDWCQQHPDEATRLWLLDNSVIINAWHPSEWSKAKHTYWDFEKDEKYM